MQYSVQWNYKSGYGGPWHQGEIVDLTEAAAAQINRDSPGVLVLHVVPPMPPEAPAVDRMVKRAKKRG